MLKLSKMNKIAGLTFEKYANGSIRKVTFDYKKHADVLKPLLKDLGAEEEDEFDKRLNSGELYTAEEAKFETKRRIKAWWGK
jgi:hypothetical protein